MIMARKTGLAIITERGTGTSIWNMSSAVGTAIAPTAMAARIRFRSGRLAKRQSPRYSPNARNSAP